MKAIAVIFFLMMKNYIRRFLSSITRFYLNPYKSKVNASDTFIVSFTSWKKRIENVPIVVDSILNNTIQPAKIVLNLSTEEFPQKDYDLPDEVSALNKNGIIEILWNEGNTKAFKKWIPTIKKYPDAAIISVDDDFIYPKDFLETFVKAHHKDPCHPLSGNMEYVDGVKAHCGCASLMTIHHHGKYIDELLDDTVISIGMDDIFYTFCAELNGTPYKYVGKLFYTGMESLNAVDGLSDMSLDKNFQMISYLIKTIKKKYHISMALPHEPIISFR